MIGGVKPTRLTQPYRRGARQPGPALNAMLKGRTSAGYNPMDAKRNVQSLVAAGKRRPKRAPRVPRPPRL